MLNYLLLPGRRFYSRLAQLGKQAALFPFLFALDVLLVPLASNLQNLRPSHAARSLVLVLFLAGMWLLLVKRVARDGHFAAYLVFLSLAYIFLFGHLSRLIQNWLAATGLWVFLLLFAIWSLLFVVLGLRKTWLRFGGAGRVTPFLNLVTAVALLSQSSIYAVSIVRSRVAQPSQVEGAILPITGDLVSLDCSYRPDIYYIVLDAYGRTDVLSEDYGVDNSEFMAFLKQKGFYIGNQSHANYIQTALSLPSSLNFSYLAPEPPGVDGLAYYSGLIAENRLMRSLEKCGYRTYSLKTGFNFTDHLDVDVTLGQGGGLNDYESLLLAGTPLDFLVEKFRPAPLEYSYSGHRARILDDFQELAQLPHMDGPKVVFAHIVSPHPPFVFAADGSPVEPARSYSLNDGDEFGGSWEEYRTGYAAQVSFVDSKLKQIIQAILSESAQPPIIILQGDHGPGGRLNWDSPDKSCLRERTSIFNAYYFPGGARGLYATISPVNSFRVMLNRFFGTRLSILPDQTFYTTHLHPRQITDITNRRDSLANCTPP